MLGANVEMIAKLTIAALLSCALAVAQSTSPSAAPTRAPAFEVVSIHPSKPGSGERISPLTTPDGYTVNGQSMLATIMLAYFPQGFTYWTKDNLSGAPSWLSDRYDISAKVSDADLAEWQKQGSTLDKKPMLRAMLQTMLADRCHLIAHMVPGPPRSGWALELGKHPPQLTESRPGEVPPAGVKLHDGGILVPLKPGDTPHITLYAATMADLAEVFTLNGHVVQDHTGLTGHYNFVIDWISDPDSKLPAGFLNSNDPDPLSHWNIEALNLKRVPVKIPSDTLIIDHIEKPSEN